MAIALALGASLLWGGADFLGGTLTRRLPAALVVLVSQAAALLLLLVVAALAGSFGAPLGYLGWSVAAGLVGVLALNAFYAALATGTMGVVAPIAALGVVVPVAVGVLQGERPRWWQLAGVAVGVAGCVLVSGPEPGGRTRQDRRPLLLALVAALGFGAVIVLVARGARTDTVMTLLTMRAASVGVLLAVLAVGPRHGMPRRRDVPPLVATGLGDVGANAAFAVASGYGLLSVVAVLSSLYPAVTVLLARAVHGERLRRVQSLGVLAVLGAVVLIASGGDVSG